MDRELTRDELLRQAILQATQSRESRKIAEVISEIHLRHPSFSNEEIRSAVKKLEATDQLVAKCHLTSFWLYYAASHVEPIMSLRIAGVLLCLISLALPQSLPWSPIKVIATSIFLLFSPGNAVTELAFSKKDLDLPETIAVSIGLSVVLVALTSLVVNFQLGHFSFAAVAVSLAVLSLVISVISRYSAYQKMNTHLR